MVFLIKKSIVAHNISRLKKLIKEKELKIKKLNDKEELENNLVGSGRT